MHELRATLVRGGTSKCWLFSAEDFHEAILATGLDRDRILTTAFGSADRRQLDGVGGATATTSKAAIVHRAVTSDADVEYEFAQVGIGDERVEWNSNCGNCATAVALYAVHAGLVRVAHGNTTVRLRHSRSGALLTAVIPTPYGIAPDEGHVVVLGTEALGVPVNLGFESPVGSSTGHLLPTGRPVELLQPADRDTEPVPATLVDAGTAAALMDAEAFGLSGSETLAEFTSVVPRLTELRRRAALTMGLVGPKDPVLHSIPKVGVVGRPRTYRTTGGQLVRADEYDLAVRMVSMHAPHPVIGLTAAVAVAVAARVPGSVPARHLVDRSAPGHLRLGTPAGVLTVDIERATSGRVRRVILHRAARRIASATLWVPMSRPTALAGHAATGQPAVRRRARMATAVSATPSR
ncbi:PrpF domain-containing protein [Streptomyces sp. NPDC052036]|uniref:PrpF domain-containing protein n=1 Tax=unclassified Streptomyces TaxID=2593676 RepID=UPI0034254CAE